MIGKAIRNIREKQEMTRTKLAKDAQVSLSWLSRIELAEKQPTDDLLERIAHALGTTVRKLRNAEKRLAKN
jgi:transcriptional regulator with XRE-family HTH domain